MLYYRISMIRVAHGPSLTKVFELQVEVTEPALNSWSDLVINHNKGVPIEEVTFNFVGTNLLNNKGWSLRDTGSTPSTYMGYQWRLFPDGNKNSVSVRYYNQAQSSGGFTFDARVQLYSSL